MTACSNEAARLLDSWDANAAAWTAAVRSGAIESRRLATDAAILDAVLERQPRKVLDLGCGEGWLVRALAKEGVAAVGVDGAAPLVEAAASAGGSFVRLSYAELIAAPGRCGEGFDLAIANFALLEEEIGPLLAALRRIVGVDGWLLVQTLHPLAAGPPYEDGWRIEDFLGFGAGAWAQMPWYFRTLLVRRRIQAIHFGEDLVGGFGRDEGALDRGCGRRCGGRSRPRSATNSRSA